MSASLQKITAAFFFIFSMLLSNTLWAAMIVEQSIVYFEPGDPARRDIRISNPDKEPIYIQVEVKEIFNAGQPDESVVVLTNPKEAGFLVTPNRLVIQPGGQQNLRLVNLKGLRDKERVIRVKLKPLAADLEAEETGVKILIGYELLVLLKPIAPKMSIKPTRVNNKLILVNEGNTNAFFTKGKQCKDETETECVELGAYRLYPGNRVEIELKYNSPVNYILSTGMSNQAVQY